MVRQPRQLACGVTHPPASRWRSYGGWRMSHGSDLFAVRDGMATRPSFELVRRGYDKVQVDQYIARADSQMASLAAERERAASQIQDLTAQVQQLQVEVSELRSRPPQVDRATF